MASATEAQFGELSESNINKKHPMVNTSDNIIVNGTAKQKISRVIDMRFYWIRNTIQPNRFHIIWEEGKKKLQIMSQNTTQSGTI